MRKLAHFRNTNAADKESKPVIELQIQETVDILEGVKEQDSNMWIGPTSSGGKMAVVHTEIPCKVLVFAKRKQDKGNYVIVELGITTDQKFISEQGVPMTKAEPIQLKGRTLTSKRGEPVVYMFDPINEAKMRGFADGLQVAEKLANRQGFSIIAHLPMSVVDHLAGYNIELEVEDEYDPHQPDTNEQVPV
jgi:hypothetical protein